MKEIIKKAISILLTLIIVFSFGVFSFFSNAVEKETVRYTALILDTSGSMSGTPAQKQKEAAVKFCEAMLNAKGRNYICIIRLNTSSSLGLSFTDNYSDLETYINRIPASGGTNINQALTVADTQLSAITEQGAIKNIVLCSDGLPESGSTSSDGPYTSSDYSYYRYANAVYNTAESMKPNFSIYTLGFFHSLSGNQLTFGRKFMNDIQNAGYYEVTDPDELIFTFGEIAGDITDSVKEIDFTYQSGDDYTAKCYYTNNYFSQSSYNYSPSLATMSICFAMSAFGSGREGSYTQKSVNAKELLKAIGMPPENIDTNYWFTVKPTTDSIGVVAGNMPITVNKKNYTLIALAVRGGGYEQEWASNFTIGTSGLHQGFNEAKNNVIEFLQDYISSQKISGAVKLWITGYSRAAATANLVGGAIDNGTIISPNITYDLSDVYTYTFETPAGALTSQVKGNAKYNNIYNIINQSDPVPYVAPAALGFARYGIDKYLPSAQANGDNYNSLKNSMLKIYNSLGSTEDYIVDNFQMKKLEMKNWIPGGKKISFVQDDNDSYFSKNQGVFLSNYVTYFARDFVGNRENYVAFYEDEIREICSVVFGCTDEQSKIMMESLVSQAKDEWGSLLWSYIYNTGIKGLIGRSNEAAAFQTISDWLLKAVKDAGIKDYNKATIDAAGKDLGDLLLALASNHPNYLTTAIMNGSGLGAAHFPELCYSWLASMDKNYTEGAKSELNNGGYRIIRINCDVDVTVTNGNNELVASIINDKPENADHGCISGVDENGQKCVILPVGESYNISITGRSDDLVNVGISEYNATAGDYVRNINYFDIDLKSGKTLKGIIPAYTTDEINSNSGNASTSNYKLYDSNNGIIKSDSDLRNNNSYYTVTATSSNEKYGVVYGSGIKQYGEYVQVEASTIDGAKFEGWYIDGECVSTDSSYRLCVKTDTEIKGVFKKNPSLFMRIIYSLMRFFQRIINTINSWFA